MSTIKTSALFVALCVSLSAGPVLATNPKTPQGMMRTMQRARATEASLGASKRAILHLSPRGLFHGIGGGMESTYANYAVKVRVKGAKATVHYYGVLSARHQGPRHDQTVPVAVQRKRTSYVIPSVK